MPGRDGTGPLGRGFGLGRGFRPRGGGPSDQCVCPACGATRPHQPGFPCNQTTCPRCGARMTRG